MSVRAGIVVTGTEVLTGRISDRNGPWLADRLLEMGIELAHITICGDRPEDIQAQLRFMADNGVDLIVTSGGLGPTADDMTVEMVAKFAGRPLVLDEALESRIADILRALMRRWGNRSFEAVRAANRKQALVPEGSHIIYPVGTAPGVVVPGKPAVVVLPGPPRELQPMWAEAVDTEIFREATAGRGTYVQEMMRLFGLPESSMAETLRDAEDRDRRLRPPRDHHLPAPRRGGGGDALRARGRRDLRGAGGADRRPPPARAVLHRRLAGGRPGGRAARRPDGGHRGVVHRGPRRRAPHRAARARPTTSPAGSWPTPTRSRRACSEWITP